MLRLTASLFLFEAHLPGTDCCVEVLAERWGGRSGERDGWGCLLEPDEAPQIILHSVEVLRGTLPEGEWVGPEGIEGRDALEAWLVRQAALYYHEAKRSL